MRIIINYPSKVLPQLNFLPRSVKLFFRDKTMWNYDLVKYTLDFLTRDWIYMRIFFAATKATFYFHFTKYKRYIIGNSTKGSALSYSIESQLEMNYGRFIFSIMFFTLIHSKMCGEGKKLDWFFVACKILCVWFMIISMRRENRTWIIHHENIYDLILGFFYSFNSLGKCSIK